MMSSWASDAGVGVERGARHEREQVATVLGVDEEHPLPRREGARHGRQASTAAGAALGSRTVMSTCSPGETVTLDTALVPVVQDAAQEEGGAGQQEPVPVARHAPADSGAQEAPQEQVHVRAAGSRRRPTWRGRAGGRPGRPA